LKNSDIRSGLQQIMERRRLFKAVRKKLFRFDRSVMLGSFLKKDVRRRSKAQAFYDPSRALVEMGSYLWAVPTLPTPFVGDAPAPGIYGNSVINRQQFRHPVDVAMPRPPQVFRIFFTGSSTAFSSGAPDDKRTITGYLEKKLNQKLRQGSGFQFEVINAACPAWASTHERLWIELRLVEMAPDMIIHFSGNNEAHWGAKKYAVDWMRTYSGHLHWMMVDTLYRRFGWAPIEDVAPRDTERIDPQRIGSTLIKNVEMAASLLHRRGIHYTFVLHPTIAETGKQLSDREQAIHDAEIFGPGTAAYFSACYGVMRKVLKAFATERNRFTYLDHSSVFDLLTKETEIFLDAYHFGDRGNDIIAGRIFDDLEPVISSLLSRR
jgi:hypothetical protein